MNDLPQLFESKTVIARADHVCCECGAAIKAGTGYIFSSGLWDHGWERYKQCQECGDVFEKATADNEPGEGPAFTDLRNWLIDASEWDESWKPELEAIRSRMAGGK